MAAHCAEFGTRGIWRARSRKWRDPSVAGLDRPCSFDMRPVGAVRPLISHARRQSVVTATATSPPKPSPAPSHPQGHPSLHSPLLSANEVHAALLTRPPHPLTPSYAAFYSSVVGGITKDPAGMVIPMDDHMVHRGHGVFDTALIFDGYLYELDAHLDRILVSAAKAKIPLPEPREALRNILVHLASAANISRGNLRYWISAGTGGFSLSMTECERSHFYAMAIANPSLGHPPSGVKVVTSGIPIKPPQFASVKSVNYLPNALLMLQAEQAGAAAGIWLDQEGFVGEGQSMNCAFVTKGGELLVPRFDPILAGCTMKRVMRLAEQLVGPTGPLNGIRFGKVTVEEGRSAAEMMLCGSGVLVEPVLQWDDQMVGDGTAGEVTLKLRALLDADLSSADDPQRIPIPPWGGES